MEVTRQSVLVRFFSKVKWAAGDACWEWQTGIWDGYGRFWLYGHTINAHHAIWELLVGPVPDGHHVDHKCRNRKCVRLSHLQAVPAKVNVLTGVGITAINAKKTHCPRGHEFTPENTYLYFTHRACASCRWDVSRRWKAENRDRSNARRRERRRLERERAS